MISSANENDFHKASGNYRREEIVEATSHAIED
jgi:hypothetical protein